MTSWRDQCAELQARPVDDLDRDELEQLADGLFWLDRPRSSIEVRRLAYQAHLDAGDTDRATLAAWRLFYEHHLVGESAPASGWLQRCRRHVGGDAGDVGRTRPAGWLAVAEADLAVEAGRSQTAVALAATARMIGEECGDRNLFAMALQVEGRARIAAGDRRVGLSHLDEAMVAVINDELEPLYTGWVLCAVVAACIGVADLGRASEWSDAAMRWCASLREGRMYPGLCRVYSVELAYLRGEWPSAEAQARQACEELVAHDPRYAGAAYYLVGELCRSQGDLVGAQQAFARAHELGRTPQPGFALARLAEGRATEALAALRTALEPGPSEPLPRAQLLTAVVEVAADLGDRDALAAAVDELDELAGEAHGPLVAGLAAAARGELSLADDDPLGALAKFRRAYESFRSVGCAAEAARQKLRMAGAAWRFGDADTARLEATTALAELEQIGAQPEVDKARALLSALTKTGGEPARATASSPLTARELEVLALVAGGGTNRAIADRLCVSPHTVNRHVSNILTKLDVGSRAAATAVAYQQGLLELPPPGVATDGEGAPSEDRFHAR